MGGQIDWIAGDRFDLPMPAHIEALRADGCAFLTDAFRRIGSIQPENSVTSITRFEECRGGGTGQKLYLSLEYAHPGPATDLFVKFSRAFGNEIRDRQKIQMRSEVELALLSRAPGFPIAVPTCMFADYNAETGTGILITEKVTFGENGVEPNYVKCLDRDLPDPLGHYQALLRALARLAAAHHAGVLPADAMARLSEGPLGVAERAPYSAGQVSRRIERWRGFAANYPQLVPERVRDPAFLDRFAEEAPRFCGREADIERFLNAPSIFVALSHWNANTDNAWFWTGADGRIECGLFDWGNARVMNLAVAIAGCFYGAEPDFLAEHLDTLIAGFVREYGTVSGHALDPDLVKHHLALQLACSGLLWMIDAPAVIEARVPDLAEVPDRYDPRVFDDELVRTQIHMSAVWLTLWRELDFGAHLDRFLGVSPQPASQGSTA